MKIGRWTVAGLALIASLSLIAVAQSAPPGQVIASELANPRGFTWGPDGALYVALAGGGGDTGQVVKVEDGQAEVVADGMNSDVAESGSVEGVAAVDFLGEDLYLLEQGGGPGHKQPDQPAGVYKVEEDGSTTLVADLSTWVAENLKEIDGHGANGDPYNMIASEDALWVVLANPDAILKVTADGKISLVVDIGKKFGHQTLTGLAIDDKGAMYIGTLGRFPFADGSAKVYRVGPTGWISEYWTGLTAVTSIGFGPDDKLYALEMSTGNSANSPFNPNSGKVVRRATASTSKEIKSGLNFPISMRFDPDGGLYVAGPALGANEGTGWISKL
jgi:hypothetical protein